MREKDGQPMFVSDWASFAFLIGMLVFLLCGLYEYGVGWYVMCGILLTLSAGCLLVMLCILQEHRDLVYHIKELRLAKRQAENSHTAETEHLRQIIRDLRTRHNDPEPEPDPSKDLWHGCPGG